MISLPALSMRNPVAVGTRASRPDDPGSANFVSILAVGRKSLGLAAFHHRDAATFNRERKLAVFERERFLAE
jgi:hypothetical protein